MSDKPEPTPDCCQRWPEIMYLFQWMVFGDWPEFYTMPHLDGKHAQIRINFCPSCGADRRGAITTFDRIYGL